MRLSEAITIYLAAGAPFGFQHFLRDRCAGRLRSFYRAARAALLWPLAAVKLIFSREGPDAALDERSAQRCEQVARAQGRLLSSLYRLAELAQSSLAQSATAAGSATVERVVRTVREAAEKYIGLTLAAADADPDGPLAQRELELYRVAGRKGADLLLAGRCVRRRNAARLIKHQARSRLELLHALAEIRETVCAGAGDLTATHHASVAAVRLYACALDLLSILEGAAAAAGVSKLLDAECARLRELEALKEARATKEETCTAYTTHRAFTGKPQTRSLSSS
ncbi:MAG TPA: hypothetical protein VN256_12280 [Pyrinomonadaceae bacterium]|nr:hypothetical protein [Pyrinomonadaceae bacterium]